MSLSDPPAPVPASYFKQVARNAARRGIAFNLSPADVNAKFLEQEGRCVLSGLQLFFGKSPSQHNASLDRIDSTGEYSPANVQFVHKDVNRMKGGMSDEKFVWMCRRVADHAK